MSDDAAALLLNTWHETGDVHQGDQRNIENIAKANKARAFVGRINIQRARFDAGIISDDANDDALNAGEAPADQR